MDYFSLAENWSFRAPHTPLCVLCIIVSRSKWSEVYTSFFRLLFSIWGFFKTNNKYYITARSYLCHELPSSNLCHLFPHTNSCISFYRSSNDPLPRVSKEPWSRHCQIKHGRLSQPLDPQGTQAQTAAQIRVQDLRTTTHETGLHSTSESSCQQSRKPSHRMYTGCHGIYEGQ